MFSLGIKYSMCDLIFVTSFTVRSAKNCVIWILAFCKIHWHNSRLNWQPNYCRLILHVYNVFIISHLQRPGVRVAECIVGSFLRSYFRWPTVKLVYCQIHHVAVIVSHRYCIWQWCDACQIPALCTNVIYYRRYTCRNNIQTPRNATTTGHKFKLSSIVVHTQRWRCYIY